MKIRRGLLRCFFVAVIGFRAWSPLLVVVGGNAEFGESVGNLSALLRNRHLDLFGPASDLLRLITVH
jgi:hypothetical protein